MKFVLLSILLVLTQTIIAQISSKHQQKIEKILGDGMKSLPIKKEYPFSDSCQSCEVDTSTTILNDTIGIHVNNEFVLFRGPLHYREASEKAKYIQRTHVSVREYDAFQEYVRDSVAREILYCGTMEDQEASEYLLHKKNYIDKSSGRSLKFHESFRLVNRRIFALNWKHKFSYDDPSIVPVLAKMYLSPSERFYRKRDFDTHKWFYWYEDTYYLKPANIWGTPIDSDYFQSGNDTVVKVGHTVNVAPDYYTWAKYSKHNNDEFSVLSQLYGDAFKDSPVVGLIGTQAAAFCHWKQDQLQKMFDKKGLDYRVVVSLPEGEDVVDAPKAQFELEEREYTNQWGISNSDYSNFLTKVEYDYIREYIYLNLKDDKEANDYLNYSNIYFDEAKLEYVELDQSDRYYNLKRFGVNEHKKLKRNNPEIDSLIKECRAKLEGRKAFTYYQYLSKERAFVGEYRLKQSREGVPDNQLELKYPRDSVPDRYGYSQSLGITNVLGHNSGVRSHHDFSVFIEKRTVSIELMSQFTKGNISWSTTDHPYEVGMAFYHWSNPIQEFNDEGTILKKVYPNAKDRWWNYVFPSKEQYQKRQRGERIIVESRKVDYPTPLFRYVVHIYPQ